MPHVSALRLASLLGLLGSALVISGFFLPSRFVTVVFPPAPATYAADSYWSMLHNTVTGGNIHLVSSEMEIGSFLLAILIPLLTSLTGLVGFGKRVISLLSLGWSILGFLEFLIFSTLLLSFSHWGGRFTETHTAGPGFWLMLSGFPLCISSSIIAQYLLVKPRPTVSKSPGALQELARGNEFRRPPWGFF
jgi:hypothetical protein